DQGTRRVVVREGERAAVEHFEAAGERRDRAAGPGEGRVDVEGARAGQRLRHDGRQREGDVPGHGGGAVDQQGAAAGAGRARGEGDGVEGEGRGGPHVEDVAVGERRAVAELQRAALDVPRAGVRVGDEAVERHARGAGLAEGARVGEGEGAAAVRVDVGVG